MIVCKLTVSFDRGARANAPKDIGLDRNPLTTADGEGLIRGLGTHFVSAEERDRVKACEAEDRRVRVEFARRFVTSPIPGTYVLPHEDAADRLIAEIDPQGVTVRAQVYDLSPRGGLRAQEEAEWVERVRNQIKAVPLTSAGKGGRGKFASKAGLDTLARLAECPVLDETSRKVLGDLIRQARLERVERVEFARKLAEVKLNVDIGAAVAPRRGPKVGAA